MWQVAPRSSEMGLTPQIVLDIPTPEGWKADVL